MTVTNIYEFVGPWEQPPGGGGGGQWGGGWQGSQPGGGYGGDFGGGYQQQYGGGPMRGGQQYGNRPSPYQGRKEQFSFLNP